MPHTKGNHNSWQLRLWQIPHLDNLELLHGSNLNYDYPLHIHEEYCIVLMLQGVETHICRGKSHKAFPGDLMLLNADEAHSSKSVGTEYRVTRIHPRLFGRIALEAVGRKLEEPYFSNPVIKDRLIFRILLTLHLKLEQNASPLEQESELVSAVGLVITRLNKLHPPCKQPGKEPHRIKRVQDYLKSYYAANVSLSQLASIADLSPFHLLRVFRNQVGISPHEYQTQLRIARAGKLIRNGHSISHAALETGFFDQSHLSRNFKRIVGVTPGQYWFRAISCNKIHKYS